MSWKNIPIAEAIVIPLAIGVVLETFFPQALFPQSSPSMVLMGVCFALGVTLIVWSVRSAGLGDMAAPDLLLQDEPYAYARNPMYLAWNALCLGVFLLEPSLSLAFLFLPAFLLTHCLAILPEEKVLKRKFDARDEQYCRKVRRYL